jgi:hypothetical protein
MGQLLTGRRKARETTPQWKENRRWCEIYLGTANVEEFKRGANLCLASMFD